jgi:serine/threonine protein kinase
VVEGDDELAERILARGFLAPSDLERASPAAPCDDSPDDRYELLELLGRGSSGEVWKARDRELGRLVAIKLLRLDPRRDSAEELERFRREALALAALRHEGIPAVFDARTSGRGARVVMELVEGPSFQRLLAEGRLPLAVRVGIVEDVARIVHFAHERGFVHRDLKPSNVVLGRDGRPRVLDFGIARQITNDSSLTQTGDILGTPGFMSPEQAMGRSREVTARSDVFSLGALLSFAVSGQLPFERTPELVDPRVTARPIQPAALDLIARRAMAKDPERRPETALVFADELKGWRRSPLRRRGILAGALCGIAAVLLGVGLALREAPRTIEHELKILDARLEERAGRDPRGAEAALDDAIRDLEAARAR